MDARVEDIQDTQRQMQHSLDRLEERLAVVERDLRQMHNPHIDRQYLVVGAVVMAAMLILLLFVTWRLI
jgi:tetrahydromethanopterin S-methyltransferase subunit G